MNGSISNSNSCVSNIGQSFQTKYNQAVSWTASNTTWSVERLALDSTDSMVGKAGKVFAALLAAIILVPCALIVSLACQIKDCLFGSLRQPPQANICSHCKIE